MGGPNVEAYRRAAEQERRRIAALRTRDGVIDLAELRAARVAADFLRGTYGRLPLLVGIRVVLAAQVGFELEVAIAREDHLTRVGLPTAVNHVPVRVVVRQA
ncbi:MAG TPA: hypothetical protein VFP50_09730 [Anaeromyxobacteraceae bacterium]|nr:hypothetical protein [Anaeromyxobacteraceae bacterium]